MTGLLQRRRQRFGEKPASHQLVAASEWYVDPTAPTHQVMVEHFLPLARLVQCPLLIEGRHSRALAIWQHGPVPCCADNMCSLGVPRARAQRERTDRYSDR